MWYVILISTNRNLSIVMLNILIVIGVSIEVSALSKRPSVNCNTLTNSYVSSSDIALSNVCSEMYCVHFGHLVPAWETPMLYSALWKAFWHGTEQLTRHETSVHSLMILHAYWQQMKHTVFIATEVSSAAYGRSADRWRYMITDNRWSTRWSLPLKCPVLLTAALQTDNVTCLLTTGEGHGGHCHCSVQCCLQPLCRCKDRPRSGMASRQYGVAVSIVVISTQCCTEDPTVMTTAIKPQPSWRQRCCFFSPKLSWKVSELQHCLHWRLCRPANRIMSCNVTL
jgi:hypothetical protein